MKPAARDHRGQHAAQDGHGHRGGARRAAHVVVDRNLVTGQNPASSEPLAAELLKKLG